MSQIHIAFTIEAHKIVKWENKKEHNDSTQLLLCHITSAQSHKFSKIVHRSTRVLQKVLFTKNDKIILTLTIQHLLIGLCLYIQGPLRQLPNYILTNSTK